MERGSSERLTSAAKAALTASARVDVSDAAAVQHFETIYTAYVPLLRKIAIRKFDIPHADADALVHDVFATYLANPSNVRDLHPYLIGAICNAARQYRRRDAKEQALFCSTAICAASPHDELVDGVIRNLVINTTLARLGASCRETLRRFYLAGESAPAIAQSRNTSANYILRLLHYCRKRAREIFATLHEAS
jgi:RNA polymerase sigma factor (sigma-70 family)